MKTVAQKMGIKGNAKTYFVDAPKEAIEALNLPDVQLSKTLKGEFDYIHLFVEQQSEQENIFPKLKKRNTEIKNNEPLTSV